jgi:integrase
MAHLDQFDGAIWTVPGHLMKNRKGHEVDFRVPLSSEALKVIEQAKLFSRDGFLFPSIRKGVISDMTLSAYMKRQGSPYRPHGFRASFRTWCDEAAGAKFEIAEAAIAHVTDSAVVRTYRQTDYLEQRGHLMQNWSNLLLSSVDAESGGTVVAL